jgi:hypothetical protein
MRTAGEIAGRIRAAWRTLPGEQRLAAVAGIGLFVTMFLPWYQLTVRGREDLHSTSLSAFQDFSWVEAAVLLVALAVLFLLFARAERRAFHLPGGDGSVILAAGTWATVLLLWRAFDKPGGHGVGAVGLEWGFLFAFVASGTLAYAGWRVRSAHRPEPPLPAAEPPPRPAPPRDHAAVAAPAPPATNPPTGATEPLTAATKPFRARRQRNEDQDQLPLTAAHGSEEPLPRDDLTLELGLDDERTRRQ